MNSPVQRGKALWSFIYTAMQHNHRFDKLKSVISQFTQSPETDERRSQRKALEVFYNIQAQRKGTQMIQLEESYNKKFNEKVKEEVDKLKLHQNLQKMQIDKLKNQMDYLEQIQFQDERDINNIKRIMNYKNPKQKIIE